MALISVRSSVLLASLLLQVALGACSTSNGLTGPSTPQGGALASGNSGAPTSAGGGASGGPSGGSAGAARAGGNGGAAPSVSGAGPSDAGPSDAGDGGSPGDPAPPLKTALQPLSVDGMYPRAIQRSNGTIVASISATQASGNLGGTIFESTDDALSFHVIGHIDEPGAGDGLCCSTLYELPHALRALPAGALLWATSVGWMQTKAPMKLPVWSSTDGGKTWSPLSAIIASAVYSDHHGLWEPEFSMLDDGTLVCHFSDETDLAHSQKLVEVRSSDGIHWGAPKETVALADGGFRPGMAVVRRGPSGVFFMSYEVCGVPGDSCTVHLRSSSDGWNWGNPMEIGLRPSTVDGKYFQHAPTLMWSDQPSQLGRFFLVGQVTLNADGSVAAENGNFVMANAENGTLSWFGIPAPAPVSPAPYDNFCPNYSSPLVPLDHGTAALELSSRWDGAVCRTYFARGPLLGSGDATGIQSGNTFRLLNVQSDQCLDVAGGSTTPQARVEQWTCNGLPPQNWTFWQAPDGTFSLKAQNSGLCLAAPKGPGKPVEQDACDGSAAQSWSLRQVGLGYYELAQAGGLCLDNAGGSITPGTDIQVWTCNALSPQIWQLQAR